jgi:hypothetical protein
MLVMDCSTRLLCGVNVRRKQGTSDGYNLVPWEIDDSTIPSNGGNHNASREQIDQRSFEMHNFAGSQMLRGSNEIVSGEDRS